MDFVYISKDIVRDWKWYKEPEILRIYIYLLHSRDENNQVKSKINILCSEIGTDRKTLVKSLKRLKSTNDIEIAVEGLTVVIDLFDTDFVKIPK